MYRERLPQLDGGLFIMDGGIETTLIFHHGLELPAFAAFDLLKDEQGTEELRRYYEPYAELAREHGVGLVLESPTWRANPDWAAEIGYSLDELDAHPTHFANALDAAAPWASRIGGLRTNASTKSHAELDEATELDEGDAADLGARHAALKERLSNVNVLGGCCGTDHTHVSSICSAWVSAEPVAQT